MPIGKGGFAPPNAALTDYRFSVRNAAILVGDLISHDNLQAPDPRSMIRLHASHIWDERTAVQPHPMAGADKATGDASTEARSRGKL